MTAVALEETLSYSQGTQPAVLADIYSDDINLAVWQRDLDEPLINAVNAILQKNTQLQLACTVGAEGCVETLYHELGGTNEALLLSKDILTLVDMYSCLFDLNRVAIRITQLSRAMCPKFHVDRVPARLVTTYCGPGSQWLQNSSVDRSKLGAASAGLPDEQSGVFQRPDEIMSMNSGDVALLKGESWIGNENRGIVHRSPSVPTNTQRLVMTFDFTTD